MVKFLLRSLFVALAAAILLEGFHLTNLLGPEHGVDLEKSLALMLLGLGLVIQAFRKDPLPRGFLRPRAETGSADRFRRSAAASDAGRVLCDEEFVPCQFVDDAPCSPFLTRRVTLTDKRLIVIPVTPTPDRVLLDVPLDAIRTMDEVPGLGSFGRTAPAIKLTFTPDANLLACVLHVQDTTRWISRFTEARVRERYLESTG